jgi:HTH-type transcriptional repressor of NAD biosynthesis genes
MNGTSCSFRQGLVVGKFCPLHRGHMHLIDTARGACDALLIVSYTKPGFDRCERAARQRWFDELYPGVPCLVLDDDELARQCLRLGVPLRVLPHDDDDAAVHRAFCAWVCDVLCGVTVDAVFTSEDYGDGFAASLSAYFSQRLARLHTVRHVCVDRLRLTVPVSGTLVRADPALERDYLHPAVRASFIDRVCLLGGESSGKTTLAAALAQRLDTPWAPEVGRERWDQKGGRLDYADMLAIGRDQVAREDALARDARRWLMCDGSALTSLFYSLDGFGRAEPALEALARRAYAVTLVCAPDFPFVQDGTRRDSAFRARQHRWYLDMLAQLKMRYVLVTGSHEARLDAALAALAAYSLTCRRPGE